mmetsp:Transcript_10232/g.33792  ORF Transcript_10232/g.33792 Transcript_10232/m.33792 type:complete len:230 (+) Transcript_10232:1334-2023(+)
MIRSSRRSRCLARTLLWYFEELAVDGGAPKLGGLVGDAGDAEELGEGVGASLFGRVEEVLGEAFLQSGEGRLADFLGDGFFVEELVDVGDGRPQGSRETRLGLFCFQRPALLDFLEARRELLGDDLRLRRLVPAASSLGFIGRGDLHRLLLRTRHAPFLDDVRDGRRRAHGRESRRPLRRVEELRPGLVDPHGLVLTLIQRLQHQTVLLVLLLRLVLLVLLRRRPGGRP